MIEVATIAGLATIQDAGRPGWMHQGVPPGGALVPDLLARANAAAENAFEEAAIEVVGALTLVALTPVLVADDRGNAHELRAGERLTLACNDSRVRYGALRGGIDVPIVLNGRGTLLVAGLGGYEGRALRRGDRVRAGRSPKRSHALVPEEPDRDGPLRVVLGPDCDRFSPSAFDTLLNSTFRVSNRSDRVGVRLVGPWLTRTDDDAGCSAPMIKGAIQVPGSGEPIVLGPDHPTTGGYPVIATVCRADVGTLMARRVGATVRFTLEPEATAEKG
ncbi:MAG: allophanate hydrolase subunit 2 family protein [Polyangiaceae bacterium]